VNTGIRSVGHTFGVQALTTALAGGSSTPAAIYGESTGTTIGDILRLYSGTITSAPSIAQFFHENSAFTGAALLMDLGNGGSGSFSGNFLDLKRAGNSQFKVTWSGTTTIGQPNQTANAAGLIIGYGGLCVDNDGACDASTTGRISAVEYTTGHADLAEFYESVGDIAPGDIVRSLGRYSVGTAKIGDSDVLGIVSTRPGVILGDDTDLPGNGGPKVPVALSGRVPVKVSTENGPVRKGDRIAISGIAGVGVRVSSTTPPDATIVGIALEDWLGDVYRSPATIEIETQKVASGSPVCAAGENSEIVRAGGGRGVEDSVGSPTESTRVVDTSSCTQEYWFERPLAGTSEAVQTATGEARVGKVMVFAKLERAGAPGLAWEYDGESVAFTRAIDLRANAIANVGRISGSGQAWSIDESGNIVAASVAASRVHANDILEVGSAEKPTGVVIYDRATGAQYCLQVENGAMSAIPGACGTGSDGSAVSSAPIPVSDAVEPQITETQGVVVGDPDGSDPGVVVSPPLSVGDTGGAPIVDAVVDAASDPVATTSEPPIEAVTSDTPLSSIQQEHI
jgi:hypothetical protein